ncbi:hypothetical protein D3C75_819160 [compost metagenome]
MQAACRQGGSDPSGCIGELGVGQGFGRLLVAIEDHLGAIGVAVDMPLQHLDQRRLRLGAALGLLRAGLAGMGRFGGGGAQAGGLEGGEQLTRGERRGQGGAG